MNQVKNMCVSIMIVASFVFGICGTSFAQDKTSWEREFSKTKTGRNWSWGVGIPLLVGGALGVGAMTAFSSDDRSESGDMALVGAGVAAGVGLILTITGGYLNGKVKTLREEGKQKGYSVNLVPEKSGGRLILSKSF